ncbi:hypothetical protein A9K55_001841 [Cordyceps militaris]|uniref:Uncharacterized protein n=1 Tax=Cordyceps militaris TaxID=73501 RepID=A0A2H4SRN3_CORMI|nr:hypothetical protein A9K55_001841 [Cordyceps militaris]
MLSGRALEATVEGSEAGKAGWHWREEGCETLMLGEELVCGARMIRPKRFSAIVALNFAVTHSTGDCHRLAGQMRVTRKRRRSMASQLDSDSPAGVNSGAR